MAKSIIYLDDIEPKVFSMYENCYVELEGNIKRELFDKAIELSPRKSLSSLSEVLNEKLHLLSDSRNRAPIRLSLLRKLSNFLISNGKKDFSMKTLEKSVKYLKGMGHGTKIIKPNFPFNFKTPSGIRIISRLYHDGGIGRNREPYYHNQNIEFVEEFCNDIKSIFGGIEIKIQKDQKKFYVELPRLLGDIFEMVGCFLGTKVDNNPSPPKWIEKLDESLIKEFVKVAMDDEGSVGKRSIILNLSSDITSFLPRKIQVGVLQLPENKRTSFMREYFNSHKHIANRCISKILLFDQKLLSKLKIKSTGPRLGSCYTDKKRLRLRATWSIQISSKNHIERFQKLIGFKSKHKNEKLETYIKNTRIVAKKNEKIINFLRMTSEIEKEVGFSTDWLVALKFNYHHQYLGRIRLKCESKNLIERIGKEGRKIKFILTDIGRQKLSMAH
jgi:hypothetical protein